MKMSEIICGLSLEKCSKEICASMGGNFVEACLNKMNMTPEELAEHKKLFGDIGLAIGGNAR
jgi:hypothetical protein